MRQIDKFAFKIHLTYFSLALFLSNMSYQKSICLILSAYNRSRLRRKVGIMQLYVLVI